MGSGAVSNPDRNDLAATVLPCLKAALRRHLDRYLDEQIFRFNNRGHKDQPSNDYTVSTLPCLRYSTSGLTYAEVTGRDGDDRTPF